MARSFVVLLFSLMTAGMSASPLEVSFDTADGIRVYGDIYASEGGRSAPVILLFHQAGSDARGEYSGIAARLLANGYNVLAIDQRSGGDRFGGVNRTLAALDDPDIGYCEAYPDLEAALRYVRESGFDGRLAAWGSSYSAALVFQLGARHADQVDAILGFSPASGLPPECSLQPYLDSLAVPALALRPQSEFALESVQSQMQDFESHGVQIHIADPGVHGSSMLNAERVGASVEATWRVVLEFLDAALRVD